MATINPRVFEEWKKVKKELLYVEENNIYPRIEEVIEIILKAFKPSAYMYNWYFLNASDGELGIMSIRDEKLMVIIDTTISLKADDYDYGTGFPIAFLFMEDKNIVTYINNQISNEKKRDNIKKQALQKLYNTFTADEIEALGI